MPEPTHSFPLPAAETSKLDEVTEALRRQPAYEKFKDLVRANPWPSILVTLLLGFFAAKMWRARTQIPVS